MTQILEDTPALEPGRYLGAALATFPYTPTKEEWDDIARRLAEPFLPEQVQFRVTNGKEVSAYIDARDVYNRLDDVVGVGGWNKRFEPLVKEQVLLKCREWDQQANGYRELSEEEIDRKGYRRIEVTKGLATITVHGVSKDGLGTLSNTEASKGCESDAIKRAGMAWGIGRYLYDLPKMYNNDGGNKISDREMARLRSLLPVPGNIAKNRTVRDVQSAGFQVDEVRTAPRPQQQAQPRPQQARPAPLPADLPRYPNEQEEQRFKPSPDALEYPEGFDPSKPKCPTCNGWMWDNRPKKASGERKASSADFTCKNRECVNDKGFTTGVWGKEPKNAPVASTQTREQVAQNAHAEHDQGFANAIAEDIDDGYTDEFDDE